MKAEFRKLEIENSRWGKKGLVGQISYSSEHGSMSLNLTTEHIDRIFEVVGDLLIETSKEAADSLTCDFIEAKKNPELEAK